VRGDATGLMARQADGEERSLEGDPVAALAALQRRFRAAPLPGAPPFAGGAVGYVGYDAVRWVERIPDSHPSGDVPWLYLAYYDSILAFDHLRHRAILVANARIADADDRAELRRAHEAAVERLEELAAVLEGDAPQAAPLDLASATPSTRACPRPQQEADAECGLAAGANRPGLRVEESLAREPFCEAVGLAKELIRAGDAFQIVLSRRLTCHTVASPLSVYRALRAINPSPYMFLLDTGGGHVVGSSPEMLVRVQDGEIETRPIAGTRPRGRDAREDAELEKQLRADEKERAEHLMLVDLGRNDIGRVAAYGTVEVPEFMGVERYSHVMHLVSSVRGQLRPELTAIEALFATFPAGTVSGAPKVRAMEIIDQLEPCCRGVYAGAVLYSDFAGNLDSCIAIRTVVMRQGQAIVQAGAGIVADSQPPREYEETDQKAAAPLQALAWAEAAERAAGMRGLRAPTIETIR
ncbi:MAG: anthranilate synthase component I family protein, partial [Acidobacteriota bacterium]